MTFECHITCHIKDSEKVEEESIFSKHWKFSKIDGDPLLGAKPHCYLTCHSVGFKDIKEDMNTTAERLTSKGIEVLRKKIEEIVYDSKTGVGV